MRRPGATPDGKYRAGCCLTWLFLVVQSLRGKIAQHPAGQPAALLERDAVHPDAVHAQRFHGEPRLAGRQVEDPLPRPAPDACRVEEQQICGMTRLERAAAADA